MSKHLPFSAPKRRSLPTVSKGADATAILQNWRSKLNETIKRSLPAPTPLNFAVTNVRGGLKLSWAPVQTPADKALGSPDGYEILKSPSGTFTDDLEIISVPGAGQASYFDSTNGQAKACHYRIRTTAGTSSSPQSVRGPESGVIGHTSIDSTDTATVSISKFDQFTTAKTRGRARFGNYGPESAFSTSLTKTGGSVLAAVGTSAGAAGVSVAPSSGSGAAPASSVAFNEISSGLNSSAVMYVSDGAQLLPDPDAPGIISATQLQGIPITTAAPADTNGLQYSALNGDLEFKPTPQTIAPSSGKALLGYDASTGLFSQGAADPFLVQVNGVGVSHDYLNLVNAAFAISYNKNLGNYVNGVQI